MNKFFSWLFSKASFWIILTILIIVNHGLVYLLSFTMLGFIDFLGTALAAFVFIGFFYGIYFLIAK